MKNNYFLKQKTQQNGIVLHVLQISTIWLKKWQLSAPVCCSVILVELHEENTALSLLTRSLAI